MLLFNFKVLLLHIFFALSFGGFSLSFVQVPECAGREKWFPYVPVYFSFPKIDKIWATTLAMSCLDELPGAFLNTLYYSTP